MVPQNSTRSRVHWNEEEETAFTTISASPSSLAQLSIGDLCHNEEKAVSDSSSMTSSSPGSKHSVDFKAILRSAQTDVVEVERAESPAGGKGRGHRAKGDSSDVTNRSPHHSPALVTRFSKEFKHSASSFDLTDGCTKTDGPHGKLFTAKLANRIGKGNMLSNIMDVTHVGSGSLLVTDLLEGKILCVTKNGRAAKHFLTEPGAEPWSSCVTPQGYVAVTFKRSACVAVWAGDGGLVREFGHSVLRCPTGLACDRQGRFIVTDEQTNRVAFFSPAGEFLKYFSNPPAQHSEATDTPRSQNNNAHMPRSQRRDGQHPQSVLKEDDNQSGGSDKENMAKTRNAVKDKRRTSSESSDDSDDEDSAEEESDTSTKRTIRRSAPPSVHKNKRPDAAAKHLKQPDRTCRNNKQKSKESNCEEICNNKKNDNNNNDNEKKVSDGLGSPDEECQPFVFNLPRYVCASPSGKIVVSDSGSHSVKVFSPEGHYLSSIGRYGSSDGQLKVPYGVCCDQHDNIFVADHYNDRVSVFSMDGQFMQHALTVVSGLTRPKAVAVQPATTQTLYVAHGRLRSTEILAYDLVPEQARITFTCDL